MYRSAAKRILLSPAFRAPLISSYRFSTVAASNQSPNDKCQPPQVQHVVGSSSSAPSAASSSSSASASASAASSAPSAGEVRRCEDQSSRQRRHRAEYQEEEARVLQASLRHVVSAFSLLCF